jgi:hypothetical protein
MHGRKNFRLAPISPASTFIGARLGGAIKIPVTLDGKVMGQTAPKTYFMWDVAPGPHKITCLGEEVVSLDVSARPGTAHFIWQEMKMGMWAARCALHEVETEKGKQAVMGTKLAQGSK